MVPYYTPCIGQCCCAAALTNVYDILNLPNIDKMTGNSSGSSHGGTDQVRASTSSLPSLKVAVAGRGAALPLGELIPVHRNAHAASCLAPLEARLAEDIGQALFFGQAPHLR